MSEKRQAVAAQLVAQEIEGFRRREAEITETARTASEQLAKKVAELGRLIRNGKATSGDPITDYFIAAYDSFDPEPQKPFRKVAGLMVGKKGQLFLVVRRERARHVFGGPGHSSESDYHLDARYTVGILTDDKLVLDAKQKKYGLPAEAYIEVDARHPAEKTPGPYLFSMFAGFDRLQKTISAGHDAGPELEILVGCNAVFAYSPNKFLRETGKRPKDWVCALNAAIRILGRDIPEAPEEKALREEEEKKELDLLDTLRNRCKLLGRNKSPRAELEKSAKELRQSFDRAKEMGLEKSPLVVLVATENGW